MGNTLTSLNVPEAGERAKQFGAAQLLRRHHNGDTCLLRAVRASSNGSCARRRLQTACNTLRELWEQDPGQSKRSLGLSSARSPRERAPSAESFVAQLVNAQNDKGESALSVAAQLGHVEAVEYLLEVGANPWLTDRLGARTALHVACLNAKASVVGVLLNQLPAQWQFNPECLSQRYIDATTISGFTPLHCAVASSDVATVRTVLGCRPLLTAASRYESYEFGLEYPVGSTPLHIAAAKGQRSMVALLLRSYYALAQESTNVVRADPRSIRNGQNQLPWQVAYDVHILSLAEVLHPTLPLSMFFAEVQPEVVLSLRCLAAAVLKQHLLRALDMVEEVHSTHSGPCSGPIPRLSCSLASDDSSLCSSPPPSCFSAQHTSKVCGSPPNEAQLSRTASAQHAQPPSRCCSSDHMGPCECTESAAGLCRGSASGIHQALVNRLSAGLALVGGMKDVASEPLEDTCDVCMDAEVGVEMQPCRHRLCVGCARNLVKAMKERPVACPFCRRGVGDVRGITA